MCKVLPFFWGPNEKKSHVLFYRRLRKLKINIVDVGKIQIWHHPNIGPEFRYNSYIGQNSGYLQIFLIKQLFYAKKPTILGGRTVRTYLPYLSCMLCRWHELSQSHPCSGDQLQHPGSCCWTSASRSAVLESLPAGRTPASK